MVRMCSIVKCTLDRYSYKTYTSPYCFYHEFKEHTCTHCNKTGASRINHTCPDCILKQEQCSKPIIIPLYLYTPPPKKIIEKNEFINEP